MRYFDEHNLVKVDDQIKPVSSEIIKLIERCMQNYEPGNFAYEPRARITLQRDMLLK